MHSFVLAAAIAVTQHATPPANTPANNPANIPANIPVQSAGPWIDLFDGETLEGWRGDATFWSVEDGCIVGRSTAETPCDRTTYLHHPRILDDFELEFEIRLEGEGANSGMQYRSTPWTLKDGDPFDVSGYQADFDRAHRYSGILYETYGRGIAVERGHAIRFNADRSKTPLAPPRPDPELRAVLLAADDEPGTGGWHRYRIVADGRRLEHWIDGERMMLAEDHDPRFAKEGILALQIHQGPAMTVRARRLRVRDLSPATPIRIETPPSGTPTR